MGDLHRMLRCSTEGFIASFMSTIVKFTNWLGYLSWYMYGNTWNWCVLQYVSAHVFCGGTLSQIFYRCPRGSIKKVKYAITLLSIEHTVQHTSQFLLITLTSLSLPFFVLPSHFYPRHWGRVVEMLFKVSIVMTSDRDEKPACPTCARAPSRTQCPVMSTEAWVCARIRRESQIQESSGR